jgi:O-antigen/teichoic acid export membrane protein
MLDKIKTKLYTTLRWSEKYTKTDMVYLGKGGFWLTIGYVISFFSSLILAIAFANFVPKEIYGTYKYVLAALAIISIPSLRDIAVALAHSVARGFEGNFKEIFLIKLKYGILSSLISLSISLYYFLNNNKTLGFAFLIITSIVPFFNALNIFVGYLSGKKAFDTITKYNGISQIFITISILITVYFTNNLLLILTTFLLSTTLTRLLSFLRTFKKIPPNNKKDKESIKYGLHLSTIDIFQTIANESDKILIYHYMGAPELAIYTIASAPVDQIRSFVLKIKDLAFPKLSQTNIEETQKTLPKKIFRASLLTLPIIILYIIIAPWLFSIFFPEYQNSIVLTQLLAIIIALAPNSLMSTALTAQKQIKSLYKLKIFGAIGRLIIYYLCIKYYGLLGLIIGRILIEIYFAKLYSYYFHHMKKQDALI